ncbi:MAG: hypothetical protein KGI34_20660 [Bradyrhizobium sp.]|nr:hypothetical protein [Bradyrhizobium sp.]
MRFGPRAKDLFIALLRRVLSSSILGGRVFGSGRAVGGLALCDFQVIDSLLKRRDVRFQRLDCPVCGVQFLLMVQSQFGDGLLKELDIALQATGATLHRLFDGADFDTGNILRAGGAHAGCEQRREASAKAKSANQTADHQTLVSVDVLR